MEFEWDEVKRQKVVETHGVDFLDAVLIFENAVVTEVDERQYYGEMRFESVGITDGVCFVVVHTERDGITRLITAWKGGKDDRTRYQESLSRRD